MDYTEIPSLLFYVSGNSFRADKARGKAKPTFCNAVSLIEDGVKGGAISCDTRQQLAWKAPGNIYAERGTLAFWWRSRYPVGPTPFPIFRVGYADHSSWDQCFLRVDYDGEGLEAFVTDINLSRVRVGCHIKPFPEPQEWMHILVAWDELYGIRLYVNGQKKAEKESPGVYFAGLDQFGPHSRIIGSWHVQSDYNFIRGGDICEISIWDQMLSDEDAETLYRGEWPLKPAYQPDCEDPKVREGFLLRSGFTRRIPRIPGMAVARKVEIHDAYDLKRWWYKGCDGIRETTWPGVYNRSRLKGRNDYFQLPDWDCYSLSGQAITFHLPYEPYDHIEISGSAYGKVELVDEDGSVKEELFTRPQGMERTTHQIPPHIGGRIRFTNVEKEEPIGDFSAYHVYEGRAPRGMYSYTYHVAPGSDRRMEQEAERELRKFIKGRYTPYERNIWTAIPDGANTKLETEAQGGYPFYNIIIPYEADDHAGLDGIELTFCTQEQGDVSYSVQVKDPLWYYRNLAHFTFRAQAGIQQRLWLDTRDRILPQNRCLYLTIAVSDPKAGKRMMESLQLRTIFKPAEQAKKEHVEDRFAEVRDITGHLTEESPFLPEYQMFNRFQRDILDLLKVDPAHPQGNAYLYMLMKHRRNMPKDRMGNEVALPEIQIPEEPVPDGVPEWAYRQIEYLKHYKKIIRFYIDKRQIANGELGGGLSDDGDFVATWAQMVLMDADGEKVKAAMEANEKAFFDQGMFTNGLCSIQADELHSSEEGLVSLAACMNAFPGDPRWLEAAMETGRSVEWITGINEKGHRHIRSTYYSGSVMATEEPWGGQQSCSYIALEPAWQVAQYNGNAHLLGLLEEMADAAVAHYHPDGGYIHSYLRFSDDEENPAMNGRNAGERTLMMPAWKLIGKQEYWDCQIPEDRGGRVEKDTGIPLHPWREGADQVLDKEKIAERYRSLNRMASIREYYCTEGHPWIDRVYVDPAALYCDRLGDPSDVYVRCTYPMNRIAWKFTNWGDDERVAILTPITEEDHLRILVCNISDRDVYADLIGGDIKPGRWKILCGIDINDDDRIDEDSICFVQNFEKTGKVRVVFPAGVVSVLELELLEEGKPYWERPDLGVSKEDIRVYDHGINVRIHSLGSVPTPQTDVVLKDGDGNILKRAVLPPLPAPTDLWPKYRDVIFYLHGISDLEGCYIEIDPEHTLQEITRANNVVSLREAIQKRKPILST